MLSQSTPGSSLSRGGVLLLAAVCLLLQACAAPQLVASERYPALQRREALRRVAVAPLGLSAALAKRAARSDDGDPAAAVAGVSHHLAEEISRRGGEVVAPSDLARAIESDPAAGGVVSPRSAARLANSEFGADAVVVGRITRWRERQGEALGATRPASVGLEITLYSAPDGQRLYTARFDQTQHALSENLLRAPQYPGGGSRWLTAEELAFWGVRELAGSLPLLP